VLGSGTDTLTLANAANTLTVGADIETLSATPARTSSPCRAQSPAVPTTWAAALDRLVLANGTNDVTAANIETVTGGTGNDTVTLTAGSTGGSFDLGSGTDTLTLANFNNTLTLSNTVETLAAAAMQTTRSR